MADVRGTYLLDAAVAQRWEAAGLDGYFKAFWPAIKRGRFHVLNDQEARPETPFPYCIYDRIKPIIFGHSTGWASAAEEEQYIWSSVHFRIYSQQAGSRTAKAVVEQLTLAVKTVFDPGTPLLLMPPDRHENTVVDGEHMERVDDETYLSVISYMIRCEGTYNRVPPSA